MIKAHSEYVKKMKTNSNQQAIIQDHFSKSIPWSGNMTTKMMEEALDFYGKNAIEQSGKGVVIEVTNPRLYEWYMEKQKQEVAPLDVFYKNHKDSE